MSDTDRPLRFAIVGLGVGRGRARMVHQTDGAELAVVCSLDAKQAQDAAAELDCEWTTRFTAVLDRDDVDVVGILTPSGTHSRLACEALHAGKHVFTTKPLDITTEACDRAIAAAEKAGKVLAVDFASRYLPHNRRIREIVQSGALGEVFLADVQLKWYRGQSYYDGGDPPGWRSQQATEGGSLANQGVHYIDLLQWFVGPVRSVLGRTRAVAHDIETEDLCNALVTFESGAWGVIVTTTASNPNIGTRIEINGSQGVITWVNNKVERFALAEDHEAKLEDFAMRPGPENIIEDMLAVVREGASPMVDGPEGRRSVALFEAVYRSAAAGAEVALADL